jgi:hypothetical protein
MPIDNKAYVELGTEVKIPTCESFKLALRGGTKTRTQGDVGAFTDLSMGLGFDFQSFDLDYGIVPFGDLGPTHRIR